MQIIKITPNSNGSRPPVQSWQGETPPEGYLEVACDTGPFYEYQGFVEMTQDGNRCILMTGNVTAYEAYMAEHPDTHTPSQLREAAYNTERVILWDGEFITVTEAAQQWQYYAAEGNIKADELQTLIAQAKAEIRAKYPDGEVGV